MTTSKFKDSSLIFFHPFATSDLISSPNIA
jgi:hypothetical protein